MGSTVHFLDVVVEWDSELPTMGGPDAKVLRNGLAGKGTPRLNSGRPRLKLTATSGILGVEVMAEGVDGNYDVVSGLFEGFHNIL